MEIKNWLKNQAAAIVMSFSNVEKNALSQDKKTITDGIKNQQEKTTNNLLNSLKNGIVTEEVKDLRWRMYKTLNAAKNLSIESISYDEDGSVSYQASSLGSGLSKIKVDPFDNYELEMVVDNSEQTFATSDALDNENIVLYKTPVVDEDKDSTSLGEVKGTGLIMAKPERQISIDRSYFPKIFIEDYTKKLNVRRIDPTKKMLEFYISKYPDDMVPTSGILIRQIKKIIAGELLPEKSFFIDIDALEFVSNNTIGCLDHHQYRFNNVKFDKIVEFNGYYVIKYIADVEIFAKDLLSDYIQLELDKKYENKELKKRDFLL